MPKRRGPSRPHSPFDAFFDRIIDDVLDKVEDALAPTLEHLSGQVARTVKEQVDRASAGAGASAQGHPRPRSQRSSQGHTQTPPPPRTPHSPPKRREPTLYDVLEVSPRASQETITAAWRAMAKKLHPDVNKASGSAEAMKAVNLAYEVLNDPVRRRQYDREHL
jgi:hypothetical protein